MSRRVLMSVLLGCALSLAVAPAPAATAQWGELPDLGGVTVVGAVANDYLPLNFIDAATGQAVGWEYDAVAEICRRLNCTVEYQNIAWDGMIAAVAEGQVDFGFDGITITEERAQQVDFTIPYMTLEQFMLVRADENRFSTPEEFAADPNLLIGSQAGTTPFYTAVYGVLDGDESNPRIKLFQNFAASVQALLTGDVDMVIMDAASSRGYIGANEGQLKIVGDALQAEDFGFIFTPGSPYTDAFNAAIATLRADGYLDYLNTKWFFLYDPTGGNEFLEAELPDLGGVTVVGAVANDYLPLNFIDAATGQAVGWEYDAVAEICRRLNCTVEYQNIAWDGMIAAVAEGQVDFGFDGITITEERAQQVDFTIPYMTLEQFMLVRADENRFSTPEEFAADPNLLIGSQAGTTPFYTAVYGVLDGDESNPRIKLFQNFAASVQALLTGDVDMVIMDAASSRGYIGANEGQLKIVGDALQAEDFGFIFTPGSPYTDAFNAAIATLRADGYLDYLNTKWFFLYNPAGGG